MGEEVLILCPISSYVGRVPRVPTHRNQNNDRNQPLKMVHGFRPTIDTTDSDQKSLIGWPPDTGFIYESEPYAVSVN